MKFWLPQGPMLTKTKNIHKKIKNITFFFWKTKKSGHMAQGKSQLKFKRNPCNRFRNNWCHRRTTNDGRTTDEFWFDELCWDKAPCYDKLPNEALKQNGIETMLLVLFSKCFNSSLINSIWRRGVISPIPNGSDKVPYVPLNSGN